MKAFIPHAHELQAIQAGTLGQFWRPITNVVGIGSVTKFQPSDTHGYDWIMRDCRLLWNDLRHADLLTRSPFGKPGDILAVKETWAYPRDDNEECIPVLYREDVFHERPKWRSPATMPAWAIRSWLRVTGVAVKRVQEMTDADAIASGFPVYATCGTIDCKPPAPKDDAKILWDSHYAKRGLSWDSNPWCFVTTVEKAERP